jgi:hypothetical protein
MKRELLTLFVFALLLPSAIAFECNSLSGGDLQVCNYIKSTNLSQIDQDLLISDIFNKNKTTPNFDFVYSWNTNLQINSPPDNKYSSSGTIINAWIKIIALMPSIIDNNTLYTSSNGKLLTVYNFQFGSLPSGTEYRDCSTYYSWDSQTSNLNVYLNNNYIGSNKITSYQIYNSPENLSFKAELTITARYKVEHYRWELINGYKRCRYYSTEYRTDSLKILDNLTAKLYKNQLSSSFRITDKYLNITQGVLQADNFTNLKISFNNSFYRETKYTYSLNYTLPFYVLTIKAEPYKDIELSNIHIDKNSNNLTFTIKDTSNCKIQLYDFFSSTSKDCDLSFNESNFSIRTDKINYYENDTIKVYLNPSNLRLNISYANQSLIANNYTELKAVLYENKITAKIDDKETSWFINVNKKSTTELFYKFGTLSFLIYFFYKASKGYLLKFSMAV